MDSNGKSIGVWNQVLLGCAINSVVLSGGMTVAFSGVALMGMESPESCVKITDKEKSWIASLPYLLMIFGSVLVGPMTENLGRRVWLTVSCLCSLVGWLCLGFFPNIWVIYVGRALNGLGIGLGHSSVSVLLAELSDVKARGPLSVGRNISFSIGVTFMYVLGYFLKNEWQKIALISSLVPGTSLVLVSCFVPESNIWLESKRIKRRDWAYFWKAKTRPEVYKPFTILNTIYTLRQMSGTSVILSYTVEMVIASGFQGDPYLASICLGVARIKAGILGAIFSGTLDRRPPITYSGAVMCLTIFFVSAHVRGIVDISSSSLIIFSLFIFVLASTIFSAMTQSMVSEVFPFDVRGMASSMSLCIIYSSSFLSLKAYPYLLSLTGKEGVFTIFAVLCTICALFAILFLPETHLKTLEEVADIFKGEGKTKKRPEVSPMLPLKNLGKS